MKRHMRNQLPRAIVLASIATALHHVDADVPRWIHYQGKLRSAGGSAVDADVNLRFRLYDHLTAGVTLFDETQLGVSVRQGLFNSLIGSATPGGIPDSALDAPSVYLGLSIDDGVELAPRTEVASVGHAIKAGSAERLVRPDSMIPAVSVDASGNVRLGAASSATRLNLDGGLQLGNDGAACNPDRSGVLRWTGTTLEICTGLIWQTILTALGPAILTDPPNSAVEVPRLASLSWEEGAAAGSYRVYVDDQSDFSSPLVSGEVVNGTTYAPAGLADGTTYYWRVEACTAAGGQGTCGVFSDTWQFTTVSGHRYWRVRMSSVINLHSPRVSEIEFWQGAQKLTVTAGMLSCTTSESGICNQMVDNATNCTDSGIILWSIGDNFSVDFGSGVDPDRFRVQSSCDCSRGSNWIVEYSDNGSSWSTAALFAFSTTGCGWYEVTW